MDTDNRHPDDALLTVREAARRLHCSQANLYALINQGVLPVVRVGRAKGYRIDPLDLQAFVDSRKEAKDTSHAKAISPQRRLKHIKLK